MTRLAMQPEPTVPPILTVPNRRARMTAMERLTCGLIAAACLAVLITAALLTPAGGGTGTHTKLGLAPCGLLQTTGVPCMTCGYTTAFSHFAHGNLRASAFVQPGGLATAIATAATFWVLGYSATTGRPAYRLARRLALRYWILLIATALLGGWAWKIFLTVSDMDGWV